MNLRRDTNAVRIRMDASLRTPADVCGLHAGGQAAYLDKQPSWLPARRVSDRWLGAATQHFSNSDSANLGNVARAIKQSDDR